MSCVGTLDSIRCGFNYEVQYLSAKETASLRANCDTLFLSLSDNLRRENSGLKSYI